MQFYTHGSVEGLKHMQSHILIFWFHAQTAQPACCVIQHAQCSSTCAPFLLHVASTSLYEA